MATSAARILQQIREHERACSGMCPECRAKRARRQRAALQQRTTVAQVRVIVQAHEEEMLEQLICARCQKHQDNRTDHWCIGVARDNDGNLQPCTCWCQQRRLGHMTPKEIL